MYVLAASPIDQIVILLRLRILLLLLPPVFRYVLNLTTGALTLSQPSIWRM